MKKLLVLFIVVGLLFGGAVYFGFINLSVNKEKVDEAKVQGKEMIQKTEEAGKKGLEEAKELGGKAVEKGKEVIKDATTTKDTPTTPTAPTTPTTPPKDKAD